MKIPVKKRVCKNMNLSKIKMLHTLTMQAVYFSVAANLPLFFACSNHFFIENNTSAYSGVFSNTRLA